MTKTITAGMRIHLDGTAVPGVIDRTTSLTSIWRITRTDGVNFYFTDHDRDIPGFDDGDGAQTYLASVGYNRTAIANNASLSVDNLDVEGVFDDDEIKEDELRAGLFDYAEVKISMVNFKDLTDGNIKMRRGRLGEVVLTPQGIFRTELRGLTQELSQAVVENYQSECRADLGDIKCKIPIRPDVLGRNQGVLLGEFYRVPTLSTTGVTWGNLIQNPGFENGSAGRTDVVTIPGWSVITGEWNVVSGTVDGLAPDTGTQNLRGSDVAGLSELRQDINLALIGLDLPSIDAGNFTADFSSERANADVDDTGRVLVTALDSLGAPTATIYDSGTEVILPVDVYQTRAASSVAIPTLTRSIRIQLFHTLVTGVESDAAFDTLSLDLVDSVTVNSFQEVYENRVYEVTVAGTTAGSQPSYDTVIGNTTVDGTATLTARDSFTRDGVIGAVTDSFTMEVVFSDARAIDDWLNGGALTFESGANSGTVREVSDFVATGQVVTLFLPEPFAPLAGQKVRVYPGCDKRRVTCKVQFANVINFQGEPDIPGHDEIMKFGNAAL